MTSSRRRLIAVLAALEIAVALVFVSTRDGGGNDGRRPSAELATPTTSSPSEATLPEATTTTATTLAPRTAAPATAPPAAGTPGAPAPRPGAAPAGATPAPRLAVQRVAALNQPIAFATRKGDTAIYVAEKSGRVRALDVDGSNVTVRPGAVLDIATRVSSGSEQGLLGIAFAPAGDLLYANYTDVAGDTRIAEYPFTAGQASAAAERTVLSVDQPFANHNGGHLAFGPDGLLYIALGDGGSAGDPQNHGQRLDSLLGKILRIDPRLDGRRPYTIPPGNPFAGRSGTRPEIWHYGLRNPWRFSFDRASGEQWIADVGQNAWEEIDHVAAGRSGANFGWNRREGAHPRNGASGPAGAVDPEYELAHSAGNCSVTGGYVYRGGGLPALAGTYVFADFCRGRLLGASGGQLRELGPTVDAPVSFGEDQQGELWVLSLSGGVFRLVAT